MRMNKPAKKSLVPKLRFPEFREAGEWEAESLETVAAFVNEKITVELVALENYVSTENILPDYGGIDKASKLPTTGSVTWFKLNDTLFSNIRPYLKKVWTSDKEGGASNDVIVIRAEQRLLPQYLSGLLKNDTFINYVMSGAKGVKMPRGDIGSIRAYPVPYPSKSEQQKIADCLSSLDDLISAQAQKIDALKTHKKGLMQQLFPAEGETVPKLRFSEFREAGEWENTELGSHCNITTGKLDANAMVENGKYRFYTCAKDYYFIDEYAFNTNALLISGNGANVGYIHHYEGKFNAYQRTYVLDKFDQEIIFIKYFLEKNLHKRISTEKKEGNTPYIIMSTLSEMAVNFPSIDEQQKIADCLSSLDDLISAHTQKLDALKNLKKGLMQQLFPAIDEVSA
jgi:type I restriction enzyme S subunit